MTNRPARRGGWLVAIGVLSVVLLSACGAASGVASLDGGDDETPSPTPTAGSEDPEEALLAFTECMRENGIDMPDPVFRRIDGSGGDGGGVAEAQPGEALPFDPNSDEFQAAQDACQHHLEGLGPLEPGDAPRLSPEEEEAFLAFAECMREHGIDMPDPGNGGFVIRPGSDADVVDPRSEEFQAAEAACREHLKGVIDEPVEESAP
jgi:hypothetical protein